MSDSFLDHLPSHERQKLRKRMSPEAYEKLRERVKGPEDLEKEMEKSAGLAELRLEMETKPEAGERLRQSVDDDVREQGIDQIFDLQMASPDAQRALEQGKFTLAVSSHPVTHEDALVAVPEGNVQEKLPVKPACSEKYVAQALRPHP